MKQNAPTMCAACGARPEGYRQRRFCYECKPALPGRPGPCRRCGSSSDYWASGLCARCHPAVPRGAQTCADCLAWGAHDHIELCDACRRWRHDHQVETCGHCDRKVAVNRDGICRLCRRQLLSIPPEQRSALEQLKWHQLFFAGMSRVEKRPPGSKRTRRRHRAADPRPVGHVLARRAQLTLFALERLDKPRFEIPRCKGCGTRPVRSASTRYCHQCVPGGPITPPPCRRCGSTDDYYSSGLCSRCHKFSPNRIGSCIDCFAWGATRAAGWRCEGCRGWHRSKPLGCCAGCGRTIAVGRLGACRLCHLDAARRRRRTSRWELPALAQLGVQLWFADMHRKAGRRRQRGEPTPTVPLHRYPVAHRQLVLFDIARDLTNARRAGFNPPRDEGLARGLERHVTDYARAHGWTPSLAQRVRQGIRVLLGIQDTPGAPIKATDVALLNTVGLPVDSVLVVLDAAGMLDDDRPSTFQPWLDAKLAGLPSQITAELRVVADVLLNGNPAPPRLRPTSRKNAQATIRRALPAIGAWVEAGCGSLREISRHDVIDVLPASGTRRETTLTALRAVFRILKARKLVFTNPTVRIRLGGRHAIIPMPANLDAIRGTLNAEDPTVAALGALVAFHALGPRDLRTLELTDLCDGRLHLDRRTVLLAAPVRDRLRTYLDYRARRWPRTTNPHLFLHHRNAPHTMPVRADWITNQLGGLAQAMREDRILDELHATGGDVRRLCDLFGLSVGGAERYLSALNHPDLDGGTD